ncbi:MAG: tetratricopeptide repeat protein [Sphingobacterium sp.]
MVLIIKVVLIIYLLFPYIRNYIISSEQYRFRYAESRQGTLESDFIFAGLINKSPTNSNYYLERSVAFNKRGMFQRGFIFLNKAVQLDAVSHLGYRGWIKLYKIRDYQGALDDFNRLDSLTKAHVEYPMSENIHFLKAICLYKLGRNDESLHEFELAELTSLDGFVDYKIKLYRAIVAYYMGKLTLSESLLNDVIKEYPQSSDANFYLSKIYDKNKHPDLAREYVDYARKYYLEGYVLKDIYNELPFELYLEDIEKMLL